MRSHFHVSPIVNRVTEAGARRTIEFAELNTPSMLLWTVTASGASNVLWACMEPDLYERPAASTAPAVAPPCRARTASVESGCTHVHKCQGQRFPDHGGRS